MCCATCRGRVALASCSVSSRLLSNGGLWRTRTRTGPRTRRSADRPLASSRSTTALPFHGIAGCRQSSQHPRARRSTPHWRSAAARSHTSGRWSTSCTSLLSERPKIMVDNQGAIDLVGNPVHPPSHKAHRGAFSHRTYRPRVGRDPRDQGSHLGQPRGHPHQGHRRFNLSPACLSDHALARTRGMMSWGGVRIAQSGVTEWATS